ncbi:hypothetical protein GQ457_08G022820 [Hibiscus cannabinus]
MYRYSTTSIDTLNPRITKKVVKNVPTAPKHPQRSPTTRNSIETIKHTSKHQENANVSLYNNNMIKILY